MYFDNVEALLKNKNKRYVPEKSDVSTSERISNDYNGKFFTLI